MNRLILFLVAISILISSAEKGFAQPTNNSLKYVYKEAFKIGCSVNPFIVSGRDSISQKIVVRQFNAITPENVMKAETMNPKPDVCNFDPADAYVEFGEKHNMFIVGHTLVWHNQIPAWFFKDDNGNPKTHDAVN